MRHLLIAACLCLGLGGCSLEGFALDWEEGTVAADSVTVDKKGDKYHPDCTVCHHDAHEGS